MKSPLTLTLSLIVVFIVTVLILSQVMPGPHKPSDYVAMGGVATLLCLALLFIVLIALPGRGKNR